MALKNYNIYQQEIIFNIGEYVLEYFKKHGPVRNWEDHDYFISAIEDIEDRVIRYFPDLYEVDSDEG